MFLKSKGGKNRSLRLFFRKIHTFNLPTIRSIQGSAGWTANCPRGPPVLSNLPGKSGVCGRRKGIHSLSQWTLSFKSLKLHPTRRWFLGICGWEKCETLFSLPNMYVIICNPRKLKVWAIGQNVRKKIYTYPLKLGPEREKTLHPWDFFKKKRFMIQEIHKLQQIASSLMRIKPHPRLSIDTFQSIKSRFRSRL